MTHYFYRADAVWQSVLLVCSQFVVIILAAGFVLLFKRRCKVPKLLGVGAAFVLNVVLYALMQLDSKTSTVGQELHLPMRYGELMLVELVSLLYGIWACFSETGNRKTISHMSIKEAFDNLPTGVCFFNEAGLPVLCNLAMQRFSFAVCGKDVQFVTDLEECLGDTFVPAGGTGKDATVFILSDASAWHLEKQTFAYEGGEQYTQYIATDVTDLYENRVALQRENADLRRVQADLQKLSANIVAVTREEEILNTKMRVHDEMGKCLLAAQKYLQEDFTGDIPDSLVANWQRAVSMIKYSNDSPKEDMLLQIRKTCEYVKLAFLQTGVLPREEDAAYILTCAVRECVTNAVRYAEATELYTVFTETGAEATVTVTNNGKPPAGEIVEGGGLATLRRRVERAGGIMKVQSLPVFKLTVTVPKGKEKVI